MKNHSITVESIQMHTLKSSWINSPFTFIFLMLFLIPSICDAQNYLSYPQKIAIDSKRNRLLVSNEGTGALVEIDSFGIQHPFIPGAGFIDGMDIVGDTIYGVGSLGKIRAYNLETKQLVMNNTITGSDFNYLSSVTSDSAGHLFISCPQLNTIYKFRISDQSYWVFASNNGLNRPNGILLEKEKNRIVVIDDSPGTSKIHAISLADSTVSTLLTATLNNPDGIVRDKYGSYYVGGYYLSWIYKIDSTFSSPPSQFYPANHFVYPTYDSRDHSLLVTLYMNHSWLRISLITDVDDANEVPEDFLLLQNYPNPFNPSTTIEYQLESQSYVKILITNILGETVSILEDGLKDAGNHKSIFNARNLTSGIYCYQIIAGDYRETKKMMLIR
jgi:hypothetical protein